jgi:Ca2+-binding EF-hand superfamily protein
MSAYSEAQLVQAVDAVFAKYDADGNNYLDANEVFNLINDALKHMKSTRQVSKGEVDQFIAAVDKSGDGKIQKTELYEIFKKVLA